MLTLPGLRPPRRRGAVRRAIGFARPYAVALAGFAYVLTVGLVSRRHRGLIVDVARRFGDSHGARERAELPTVAAESVAPDDVPIAVRALAATDGNVTERELVILDRIVRSAQPARVFEFGTFDGRTTLNVAANLPPGGRVLTLDLPQAERASTAAPLDPHELVYVDKSESGLRYRGSGLEPAIEQLYGDSGAFDFAPYEGTIDLVFVDASHAYEYVVNDSLHALRLLGPRGGIVLWHDYGRWDGVTRALNDLRRVDARFGALVQVEGTTLALLRVAGGAGDA